MQLMSRFPVVAVVPEYAGFVVHEIGPLRFRHRGVQDYVCVLVFLSVNKCFTESTTVLCPGQEFTQDLIAHVFVGSALVHGIYNQWCLFQLLEREGLRHRIAN